MLFKQPKERPWSERMFIREKMRNMRPRNEPDSLGTISVETVMLGALCSCVALAAIGSPLGQ
jgi:hypothetical protein